jgi:hypothetical protein
MAKSQESVISIIRSRIHSLLHDAVIQHTIVTMRELQSALNQLAGTIRNDLTTMTDEQKDDLKRILLPLTSESIREALHKGELHITNSIIRSKNRILTALGEPIPDGHEEIDPNDFPNYHW